MNAHSRGVRCVRHRDSLGIGTRIRAKLDFVPRLDTRATPKNVACDKPTTSRRKLARLFSGPRVFPAAFFTTVHAFSTVLSPLTALSTKNTG